MKKRAYSDLNEGRSNFLASKPVRVVLGLYVQNIIQINSRLKKNY